MKGARSINIAILAMGGEGGGVLADWLVRVGETSGYLAQTTSVPGVSQRTGATIYYLELFPKVAMRGRTPVLGLTPMPGDIDLVVASELMEAGRAIQRGLVTPDRTHLVASTHRVYSMTERTALGDGRVDAEAILKACSTAARKLTRFDMAKLAEANRSVISAALFGAIAGSHALPFRREAYEAAIRSDGVGVSASLATFAAAYAAAAQPTAADADEVAAPAPAPVPAPPPDVALPPGLGGEAATVVRMGVGRTVDYQDDAYAREYVERLRPFIELTAPMGAEGQQLLSEVARQLALGMSYEDTVRVAELKIRNTRFDRVRAEVGADSGQVVDIVEFMHPRIEEIADTMPAAIGRWMLRNRLARAVLTRLTARGRKVHTTSLHGFLLLYCVASLKRFRRGSLRHDREMRFLAEWLETVRGAAAIDPALALGFARLRNMVKGYGDTCARGRANYQAICALMSDQLHDPSAPARLKALLAAAEKDETGVALHAEMDRLRSEIAGAGLKAGQASSLDGNTSDRIARLDLA